MSVSLAVLVISSVPELLGYGARGIGTASTLTATAAAHEAVYYNPANLAFSRAPSFSVGFVFADMFLSIDGEARDHDASAATLIGFDVPLPLKGVLTDRLTIGFGFVLPVGSVLVADIPRPGDPRFVRFERRTETVSLMGGLGVRILEELAAGVGFIALAELEGAIAVAPNEAGRIGTTVKDQLVADYALIAGATLALEDWTFALVFRDESAAEFDLPITASLGDDFPLPIPELEVSGTAQYDPRQLTLGATWKLSSTFAGSIALAWENWSTYKNPIVYTAVPPGYPEQPPADFRDIFSGRLGGEYFLDISGALFIPRAGLGFSPSPVPAQTGFHNYLDNMRMIFAGGLGFRWRLLRADLGLQWQLLFSRTENKEPPARKLSHGGHVLATALEVGVEL